MVYCSQPEYPIGPDAHVNRMGYTRLQCQQPVAKAKIEFAQWQQTVTDEAYPFSYTGQMYTAIEIARTRRNRGSPFNSDPQSPSSARCHSSLLFSCVQEHASQSIVCMKRSFCREQEGFCTTMRARNLRYRSV